MWKWSYFGCCLGLIFVGLGLPSVVEMEVDFGLFWGRSWRVFWWLGDLVGGYFPWFFLRKRGGTEDGLVWWCEDGEEWRKRKEATVTAPMGQ